MNAKTRLTSRTYWVTITAWVAGMLATFGIADFTEGQQAAIATFLTTVCVAFAKLRDATASPIKGTETERKAREDLAEAVQRGIERLARESRTKRNEAK